MRLLGGALRRIPTFRFFASIFSPNFQEILIRDNPRSFDRGLPNALSRSILIGFPMSSIVAEAVWELL